MVKFLLPSSLIILPHKINVRHSRLAVFHLEGGKSLAQKLTTYGINSNCNESRVFFHEGTFQGRRLKSTASRSNRASVNEFYLLDVLNA